MRKKNSSNSTLISALLLLHVPLLVLEIYLVLCCSYLKKALEYAQSITDELLSGKNCRGFLGTGPEMPGHNFAAALGGLDCAVKVCPPMASSLSGGEHHPWD